MTDIVIYLSNTKILAIFKFIFILFIIIFSDFAEMEPPRSVLKKREIARHEDNKHVTFACPNSPATGSSNSKQLRKQIKDQSQVHNDQRKRQKTQQSGSKKKAKHNEQIAQLQQCEEILADVEFDTKSLDQKVWEYRQSAGFVLSEMGDLVLRYADVDNKCIDLEETIADLDRSVSRREYLEGGEAQHIVEEINEKLRLHRAFEECLTNICQRLPDEGTQAFHNCLPELERLLLAMKV